MTTLWVWRDEVWQYRESTWTRDSDLPGYLVFATDGRVGSITSALTAGDGALSVCINTCQLFGGPRLLPARAVASIRHETRSVALALTTQQVRDAPCDDSGDWCDVKARHEAYYRRLL